MQGNIAEENHYYAYGLKIATLSSKKLGDVYEGALTNNYLYNGKELFDDADLGWYDYGFRNYDPQIARFTQLDPLTFDYPFYTPFQFAGCEPIANVDLDGLEPFNVLGYVGDAIVTSASFMQPVLIPLNTVASAGGKIGNFAKVAAISSSAIKASNLLNSTFSSGSTCQGCHTIKGPITISRNRTNASFNNIPLTQEEKNSKAAEDDRYDKMSLVEKAQVKGEDFILQSIHQESVNRVENSASSGFPVLGSWLKSGRYKLMGSSFNSEANSSLKRAVIETAVSYGVGKIIGLGTKYFSGTKMLPRSSSLFRSVGADINTAEKVLQRGGQSLTKSTLSALKLTKEQGRDAIHALKKDLGLGNDYHGVIRGNGDYFDPSNKIWQGNLFDYL